MTYKRLRETLQSLGKAAAGDGAAAGLVEVLFGRRAPRFQPQPPPWKALNAGASAAGAAGEPLVVARALCLGLRHS